MATYNGADYLEEQLASLAAQQWPRIDIVVRDDGSSDDTLKILDRWKATWNKGTLIIHRGNRKGFAENFRLLLLQSDTPSEYLAFCDQDDIWHADKVAAAVSEIQKIDKSVPVLYASRTCLVDVSGRPTGESPFFRKAPSFRNAIVQSIAGGNTMILNSRAADALRESAHRTSFVSHDWWAYLIITGCGGRVIFDRTPRVDYRQHSRNLVGSNYSFTARLNRLHRLLLRRDFSSWNYKNLRSLNACRDLLIPENQKVLDEFARVKSTSLIARLQGMRKSGAYRQSHAGTVALWISAAIGRL